tara:strand:+ start:1285 stop:1767 length:483 start_codon:yes stop_codon:yes gene_type:complete
LEDQSFSIWITSTFDDVSNIKNQIDSFANEENKNSFEPHVTLVTKINSLEKGNEILEQIKKEKITITFDKICEGKSFFQRLYLTASDNIQFNNAVINLEGWPSLWVPHLSLYYGNELPNSFPSKSFDNIIPITVTFDTLGLYKTGPIVSEWKEITTLFLD